MPSWGELLNELNSTGNNYDIIRRKYLKTLYEYTGRNVIAYYSAFLQRPGIDNTAISDIDKNAFMECIYQLDKSKGLDLILHTPGGNIAATESLVTYLKKIFGNDIRVIVPQIAMSAGTMISLSAKEILMGKQSNLGPIDPQVGGMSCAGIIEEFESAIEDIKKDSTAQAVWLPIISKYHPTFLGDCKKAMEWADTMVRGWLHNNMFKNKDDIDAAACVDKIVTELSSHKATLSHERHIDGETLKSLGVKIIDLEGLDNRQIGDCKDLHDCVLSIHHSFMLTLSAINISKIVENHEGKAMIFNIN